VIKKLKKEKPSRALLANQDQPAKRKLQATFLQRKNLDEYRTKNRRTRNIEVIT
jgi:hypothetical protein